MTRAELIDAVTQRYPTLTPYDVEQVVNALFEEITAQLSSGNSVELRNFGTFGRKFRPAWTARNPRSREPVEVPAKYVPFFKPGKDLRTRINTDPAE